MKRKFTLLLTTLLMLGAGSSWATVVTSISNLTEWKSFVSSVSSGDDYSSTTVTLTANITMETSGFANQTVGTSDHPFTGTFDGGGYTLTYNFTSLTGLQYCAPFRYIKSATIKNLKIAGEMNVTDNNYLAGIVGYVGGSSTSDVSYIDNCTSSMALTNSASSGDGRIGGIVGYQLATSGLQITNCLVEGTITGRGQAAGVMGYKKSGASLTLSSVLTTSTMAGAVNRFVKSEGGSETLTNCYYITSYVSDNQGTEATSAKLLTGEIAYNLQGNQATQYWGQGNLNKSNIDAYPSLTSDSKKKVVLTKISGMSTQPYVNPGGAVPNPCRYGVTGFKLTSNDANSLETMPEESSSFVYGTTSPTELVTTKKMYCVTLPADAMTLILPFDAELPSGITAYDISYTSGDNVTATSVTKITANKPVLINGTKGTLYKFSTTSDASYSASSGTNGALTGVFVDQGADSGYNPIAYVPANSYVLQNGVSGLGFYKVTEANKIKITSFRAYLTAQTQNAPMLSIDFGNNTTGITDLKKPTVEDDVIYNLNGMRVTNPSKGLYIVNGKKVVIK